MKNLYLLFLCIANTSLYAQKQSITQGLANTNIYEVNVRQYTPEGTFNAFAKHLPRLQKMGVKTIWFMPIQPIGIKNRKGSLGSYYSIKDYKAINPEFGTMADFKKVVDNAHQLGMRVIIDWVANHTAWDNSWVQKHPEYYHKDSTGNLHSPYDWGDVVQLDTSSTYMHKAMTKAMEYWIKNTSIDGFRCDMAHLLPIRFWVQARKKLDARRKLIWLAETDNNKYFEAFDIIYGWEWLHKMEDYYKGKATLLDLDDCISNYYKDYKIGKYRILFTSNHDENSWSGSEYERLGASAKTFATLCATLPGIPLVYSGQEQGIKNRLRFFDKDTIAFTNYPLANFYSQLLTNQKAFPIYTSKNGFFNIINNKCISYQNKNSDNDLNAYYLINMDSVTTECNLPIANKSEKINVDGKGINNIINLKAWDYKLLPLGDNKKF